MSAEDIIPDITAMPLKDSSDNRLILFKLIPPAKKKGISVIVRAFLTVSKETISH
jgi:hypothetical protein